MSTYMITGGTIDRLTSSCVCTGTTIGHVAPGVIVTGSGNTIQGGRDFHVVGSGNKLFDCHYVTASGSGIYISDTCSHIIATGSGITCLGTDCTVTGSGNASSGKNRGSQSQRWQSPSSATVFSQTFEPGSHSYNYSFPGNLTRPLFSATTHGANSPAIVIGDFIVNDDDDDDDNAPPTKAPVAAVTYPDAPADPEPSAAEGEDEKNVCILCSDRRRATAMVPCGHSYACIMCVRASKPVKCAICNADVKSVIRVIQS
jgi:hypothetical protein